MPSPLFIDLGDGSVLGFGRDGWAGWLTDDRGPTVWIRVEVGPGGRLVVAELVVSADRVTGRALNGIPLGRIEAAVNVPRWSARVKELLDQAPALGELNSASACDYIADAFAVDMPMQRRPRRPSVAPRPLNRPQGTTRYPDRFYADVAAAYMQYAALSASPAAEMARANGVPVTTIHRWVKEARARDLLAPSSRAKEPS